MLYLSLIVKAKFCYSENSKSNILMKHTNRWTENGPLNIDIGLIIIIISKFTTCLL